MLKFKFGKSLKNTSPCAKGYLNAEALYNDIKKEPKLFDLILFDHILPGIKGLELFKKLKKEGMNTNFIIITGLNDPSLAVESIKSRVMEFSFKHFEKEFLLDKIK